MVRVVCVVVRGTESWICNKTVNELLALNFLNDVLVVIVTQGSRQFIVVHVVLILSQSPQFGYFLSINQFKFALIVSPSYDGLVLVLVDEKFEQELPQRYIGFHFCLFLAVYMLSANSSMIIR